MEDNMARINKELTEIKNIVSKADTAEVLPVLPESSVEPTNAWFDSGKLASMKAKFSESVLVINKTDNEETDKTNTNLVESMVLESKIPVKKSYKSKDGNLVVVCETVGSRDALKNQVAASNDGIKMKTPKRMCPVVSIVGLSKIYNPQEVIDVLVQQNSFIRQFSESNNIEEHISVFAVKQVRNKNNVFQAFARISHVLREGFKTFNDKIVLGLSTCKIYDQYHVKRCNNCQSFGHYYKNCSTHTIHVCAKCGCDHQTRECDSTILKCVNCVKAGLRPEDCAHSANDRNCKTLLDAQEKMKTNLNM